MSSLRGVAVLPPGSIEGIHGQRIVLVDGDYLYLLSPRHLAAWFGGRGGRRTLEPYSSFSQRNDHSQIDQLGWMFKVGSHFTKKWMGTNLDLFSYDKTKILLVWFDIVPLVNEDTTMVLYTQSQLKLNSSIFQEWFGKNKAKVLYASKKKQEEKYKGETPVREIDYLKEDIRSPVVNELGEGFVVCNLNKWFNKKNVLRLELVRVIDGKC